MKAAMLASLEAALTGWQAWSWSRRWWCSRQRNLPRMMGGIATVLTTGAVWAWIRVLTR